jgi:hypothetical protein
MGSSNIRTVHSIAWKVTRKERGISDSIREMGSFLIKRVEVWPQEVIATFIIKSAVMLWSNSS